MSFQGLISGSECAVPSNPLSQVLKHTEGDRSLQQDRSTGPSSSRLHQLPGTAPVVANQQDVTLARQFFAGDTQKMGPVLSYMPSYAPDLSRVNTVVGGPNESWALEQQQQFNALEESKGRTAWAAEFGASSQMSSPPLQTQHPTTVLSDYQRATYMNPIGSYGASLPMTMNFGFSMQPSFDVSDTIDKGKGKAREVDFEAAFAQVAASFPPAQETSGIVEVPDGVAELEDAMKATSLETSTTETDTKQVWDHLQNSDFPPPKDDVANWEAEFNRLMSDQRDELDHDYGATTQNAWENGVGDYSGTNLGEQPLKFDAEGIPILGEYVFESNNKYMDPSIVRSLLDDAKVLLEQNGSLSEAGLLLEAAIQRGELGEGGYEAWILLGETRVMDEREEAGMRSLMEVFRLSLMNLSYQSLAISFTNESYDRASHTMLLRWLRARHPSLEVPESTIQAMATHSSWDTHNRITELFLTLARSQHAEGVLDPDVQIGMGVLFYTNGEYDRAKDCFESALTVRPKVSCSQMSKRSYSNYLQDYTLWNRLGSCLSNGNRPEEALGAYQQALQLRPTYTRAIYNVGVACLNIGAHKEAAEHFLSALNLQESASGDTSDQLWYTLRRSLMAMVNFTVTTLAFFADDNQDRPDLAELAKPETKSKIGIFRKEGFDF
ncbi:Peroxisomal targeting signal receptor [Termitomyces sp. J132]|nr:Peroxisomal targeting signal receptor [Termitomyces sp. J132]